MVPFNYNRGIAVYYDRGYVEALEEVAQWLEDLPDGKEFHARVAEVIKRYGLPRDDKGRAYLPDSADEE